MAALLTDQFRIFSAQKFIKALEGPISTQSDSDAGATFFVAPGPVFCLIVYHSSTNHIS